MNLDFETWKDAYMEGLCFAVGLPVQVKDKDLQKIYKRDARVGYAKDVSQAWTAGEAGGCHRFKAEIQAAQDAWAIEFHEHMNGTDD